MFVTYSANATGVTQHQDITAGGLVKAAKSRALC
jgi:hypothetical protein